MSAPPAETPAGTDGAAAAGLLADEPRGPRLPWPPDRRPLSVVAFGNSVTTLQLPLRQDRADGTYLEVLADQLTAAGVPTAPHLEGRWFDFIHRGMREYQQRVRNHLPDVVVIQYGLNESQPWLVPVWLIRHLLVQHQAVTRSAKGYRKYVAQPLWKQVRTFRRAASPVVGTKTWQMTPRRFGGQLRRCINNVRLEARPLVLVLDINEPGDLLEHFLPGMHERHRIYQETIRQAVASFDSPEVRLVEVSRICRELGPGALPDGMHFSAAAHRAVGEALATEVLAYLRARSGKPGAVS